MRSGFALFSFLPVSLALALSAAPAAAQCPVNSVSLGGYGTLITTQARLDSTRTLYGSFHAKYDLTNGSIEIDQCCNLYPGTFVDVTDEYDLIGVPPGTPVSCSVEFVVSGMIQTPGGVIVATLDAGGPIQTNTHVSNQYLGWYPIADQLHQALTIVAGTPQRIRFALAGMRTVGSDINASASSAHGGFYFAGLPAGVTVVSCQGYPDGVVPARASTWGSLKSRYR